MTESSTDLTRAVLVDTSVLIGAEDLDLDEWTGSVFVVSAITIGELAYGADIGPDPEARRARLRDILYSYEVAPFGVEEGKLYGALATLVRLVGRDPRPRQLDLQIAATAAAERLPLLTCNPDDFIGVERLVDVVEVRRADK
jgi:predicted nucleic acid-binding protein